MSFDPDSYHRGAIMAVTSSVREGLSTSHGSALVWLGYDHPSTVALREALDAVDRVQKGLPE